MADKGSSDRRSQVLESLAHTLFSGELKPGEVLPKEVELCEHHGVSRSTIRSCLGELVSFGIISRTSGHGTHVQPYEEWMILSSTVANWVAEYSSSDLPFARELYRFRATTEPYVCAEAALKARAADLARIETAWEGMLRAHENGSMMHKGRHFGEWDIDLHVALYHASQSLIWQQFSKTLRAAFFSSIRQTTTRAESDIVGSIELHRVFLEAVRLRDAAAAFQASCDILRRSAEDLGDMATVPTIGAMKHRAVL